MREELVKKLQTLQERKRLMCSRSTKIREIELKRKIINNVLEIVPKSSETATNLREMESEVNKQDIALRPWKERKLMKSTNPVDKTQTPAPVALKPIPVRDPSRIHADSLRKGSLEWRLDYAVESGRIDLAEKISDFIGEGCSSPTGPPNKTIPMEVGEQTESRERLKFRRPVWLFQAKERWEAKSNM